jgi:hypothetical protein
LRVNTKYTITAGTPINLATGTSSAPSAGNFQPAYATRIFIQMLHGGSGLGYVMDGIPPGTTPAVSTNGHLTAELAAASLTAPGGSYSDSDPNPAGGIDIRKLWIDGSNSGDTVSVSVDYKC